MHAPDYVNWAECSAEPVFVGGDIGPQGEGDTSPDPIQGVLPRVIEHTNRVLVGNGDYGMSLHFLSPAKLARTGKGEGVSADIRHGDHHERHPPLNPEHDLVRSTGFPVQTLQGVPGRPS